MNVKETSFLLQASVLGAVMLWVNNQDQSLETDCILYSPGYRAEQAFVRIWRAGFLKYKIPYSLFMVLMIRVYPLNTRRKRMLV